MDKPPPPEKVSRHVADGRKGDQIEQDQRYQIDHQNSYDPGGLARGDRRADHVVGEDDHDHDDAEGGPTWRLDVFPALIDEPQRRLVASGRIQSDDSVAFREAQARRGAENGDGESSV